jgi:probable rRNA maturation factor
MVILRKPVVGATAAGLGRFLTRACRAAKLQGAVQVLVTSSRDLQALNRRFLGQDRPTDVLSFPALPGLPLRMAGDLAISAGIAAQNARRLGHTTAEEIKILILHGVLHLAGYDHERDDGEMARREMKLRQMLGLPAGLIERAAGPQKRRDRR